MSRTQRSPEILDARKSSESTKQHLELLASKRGIHGIEYKHWEIIFSDSQAAAFDLEGDLIYQHQPRFNSVGKKQRQKPRKSASA